MGADPEFIIKNSAGIIYSDSYDLGHGNEFGEDGSGIPFELRPKPAYTPEGLVKNIKEAMQEGSLKQISTAKWQAGSFYRNTSEDIPIGGHIHFGTKGIISPAKLIKFLDIYLGIPVSRITNEDGKRNRRESGYGEYGDYRVQKWGVEYRTLSSWLISPQIAKAVLSLAKVAAYECIKCNRREYLKLIKNRSLFIDSEGFGIHTIIRLIRKFKLYKKYKKDIEVIFSMIKKKKTWNTKTNIRTSWGIKFKKINKKLKVEEILI